MTARARARRTVGALGAMAAAFGAPGPRLRAAQPAAARPAAGPQPPAALADRRLAQGLDAAAFAAVRDAVTGAAAAGLPVEPLVARALAGVELGAPPARVVGAVRALAARLAAARDALAPAAGPAELTAGADALAAGVPASVLRDLRRLSPGRSAAVALGVLAQLVSRGVPAEQAAARVTGLVRRGARPGQLAALDAAVQADVAAGVPASRALDGRARELADAGRLTPGPLVPPLSTAPGVGDGVYTTTGLSTGGGAANDGRAGLPAGPRAPTTQPTDAPTPPAPRPPPRRP